MRAADTQAVRRRNTAFSTEACLMSQTNRAVQTLRELIDAIDRRVAHVDRPGEARIAREAAGLRKQALQRIEELTAGPGSGG